MISETLLIDGPESPIPALLIRRHTLSRVRGKGKGEGRAIAASESPAVILCHGFGCSKESNLPELECLAKAGFLAVGLDAPSHGERRDGRLEALKGIPHPERYAGAIEIVRRAAREIPFVVRNLLDNGAPSVGLVGISMGGVTGFASCILDPRPSALVAMMASPDFRYRVGPDRTPLPGYEDSPHLFPERFPPMAVKIITAGRDTIVPPSSAREFAETLLPFYSDIPDRLSALHFPESEHMMRPQDWDAAWEETTRWLASQLKKNQ